MKAAPKLLIAAALVAGLAVGFCRPALIRTEKQTRLVLLWRGQPGRIDFVNSVTGRPVAILFRIGKRFADFAFATDESTELYYTAGLYELNPAVAADSTDCLRFCSVQGISLTLGSRTIIVKGSCLEVSLLWTIW